MPFVSPKVLCRRLGLKPKKSLGQHFLLHPDQARRIVAALELEGRPETVVEIGAGLGALTVFLAEAAAQVFAVEMDVRLAQGLSSEVLADAANVTVITQNVLHFDFIGLSENIGHRLDVIGNLPYQITSPLLFKLIAEKRALHTMVFMVQQEVGQRLLAQPGSKDYGILSVLIQYHTRLERLFSLGPNNFYPPPKVDSLVIRLRPDGETIRADDEAYLVQVVKIAFSQRRKTLKNTLATQAAELRSTPEQVLAILEQSAIDPKRRAETLGVADFVRLSNAIRRAAELG
ncbi:MAG: ribosomal RNA small subunit methyltransferase A [Deltaproteobacteria bacterium]|nr:ribosomal RNA small subunit methyltransferase A [Deltaproteobacteria bacterium]MBW1951902.1 ribosomal RNA small subunit methyltransferase A [Deltaproteobacteria bacterium]MBW1986956.1 ribosomal RNA small subunit methyltransferase A [Deltaproteobacteria bacterium]MBW2134471.1 ribosomal RNA small subunit methyltransferase A [Deltaproteobacteria bacterium]